MVVVSSIHFKNNYIISGNTLHLFSHLTAHTNFPPAISSPPLSNYILALPSIPSSATVASSTNSSCASSSTSSIPPSTSKMNHCLHY